jgi:hypothetical protein
MSLNLAHSDHPLEALPANAAAAEIQAGAQSNIPEALCQMGTELRAAGFTAAMIDQVSFRLFGLWGQMCYWGQLLDERPPILDPEKVL